MGIFVYISMHINYIYILLYIIFLLRIAESLITLLLNISSGLFNKFKVPRLFDWVFLSAVNYICESLLEKLTLRTINSVCHLDNFNDSLTRWGQNRTAVIFQTTIWTEFCCMKIVVFRFTFHFNLVPRVQSIVSKHWYRLWSVASSAPSHYLNQLWLSLLTYMRT